MSQFPKKLVTNTDLFKLISPSSIIQLFGVDPNSINASNPYKAQNFVNGQWKQSKYYRTIIDPLNGEPFIQVPDTKTDEELHEFKNSLEKCPKYGLHNPFKNPESHRLAYLLSNPLIEDYFTKIIQRVAPKSDIQARLEVKVCQKYFMNYSGDQVRFTFESFNVSGDHPGQQTCGYRWPYGPVGIIAPFNFPLEVPALQLFGALMAGNKALVKGDSRVSVVIEAFIKLLLHAGLQETDVDLIHSEAEPTTKLIQMTDFRMVQFTGSSQVADKLSRLTNGKIKIEGGAFDWKILGPDVGEFEYVSYQCDQDAFSYSGQKCSAQSILFAHKNWVEAGLLERIQQLASRRSLKDLTIVPVFTWTNKQLEDQIQKLLRIPGTKIICGGQPVDKSTHRVPECYGCFQPTSIFVPLDMILKAENFDLVTQEVFGPLTIVTQWDDDNLDRVLEILERFPHDLTAGIVSNNIHLLNHVIGCSVNGVTYTGLRGRTSGAPQNHWFGPCGDPRGNGIGTPRAIVQTWTSHREIIRDYGPLPKGWKMPNPS